MGAHPQQPKGNEGGNESNDHALHQKGEADEGIGGADIFHNIDLPATIEDRHPDGIGNDNDGNDHQNSDDGKPRHMDGGLDTHQGRGHLIAGFHAFHPGKALQRLDGLRQIFQAVHFQAEGSRQRVFIRVLLKAFQKALAAQGVAQLLQGVLLADVLLGGDIGQIVDLCLQPLGAGAAEVVIDPDHNLIEAFYIAHQGIDIEGKQQRPADKHHTGNKHADGSHRHLPVGADIVQALLDQIAKGILKHGKHLLDPG